MNSISIVIPIFNEQDNINLLFKEINDCLSSKINYEIIFVDDGSVDNSKIILNKLTFFNWWIRVHYFRYPIFK